MVKKVILLFCLIFLLGSVKPAKAQGGILKAPVGIAPDSPFYFIETIKEKIVLFFTFDPVAKAEKLLDFAEERLVEAEAMVEKGKPKLVEKVIKKYKSQVDEGLSNLKKAEEKGKNVEELLERLHQATLKHQVVLQGVYEKVPEEAKEAIKHAIEVSQRGFEHASEAIQSEKKKEILLEEVKKEVPELRNKLPPGLEKKIPLLEEEEEEGEAKD